MPTRRRRGVAAAVYAALVGGVAAAGSFAVDSMGTDVRTVLCEANDEVADVAENNFAAGDVVRVSGCSNPVVAGRFGRSVPSGAQYATGPLKAETSELFPGTTFDVPVSVEGGDVSDWSVSGGDMTGPAFENVRIENGHLKGRVKDRDAIPCVRSGIEGSCNVKLISSSGSGGNGRTGTIGFPVRDRVPTIADRRLESGERADLALKTGSSFSVPLNLEKGNAASWSLVGGDVTGDSFASAGFRGNKLTGTLKDAKNIPCVNESPVGYCTAKVTVTTPGGVVSAPQTVLISTSDPATFGTASSEANNGSNEATSIVDGSGNTKGNRILYHHFENGDHGWYAVGNCSGFNDGIQGRVTEGSGSSSYGMPLKMIGDWHISTYGNCEQRHDNVHFPAKYERIVVEGYIGGVSLDTANENTYLRLTDGSGNEHRVAVYDGPTMPQNGKWGAAGDGVFRSFSADVSHLAGKTVDIELETGAENGWRDHSILDDLLIRGVNK